MDGQIIFNNGVLQTDKFGRVEVNIVFKRRWIYHLITIFLQEQRYLFHANPLCDNIYCQNEFKSIFEI